MRSLTRCPLLLCALLAWAAPGRAHPADPWIEASYHPATRPRAIRALDSLTAVSPGDPVPRAALARALSWSGRLPEAVAEYDTLLAGGAAPGRGALWMERSNVLAWEGRLGEAAEGYRRALGEGGDSVAARVGLARIARWSGRPLEARALLEREEPRAPRRADVAEELAASDLDLGLPGSARRAAPEGPGDPDLPRRLRAAAAPCAWISPTFTRDRLGTSRFDVRASVSPPALGDSRWLLGAELTRIGEGADAAELRTAAAGGDLRSAHAGLEGGIALRQWAESTWVDGSIGASLRPSDRLRLECTARRRPFVEPVGPLEFGDAAYYEAPSGGVRDIGSVMRIEADEVAAALQANPVARSYLYIDGRAARLSDTNRISSLASGAGFDMLRFWPGARANAFLQWDGYWSAAERTVTAYFSPRRLDSQSLSASLHCPVRRHLTLLVSGGGSWSADTRDLGWNGGAGCEAALGALHLALRADAHQEPTWSSRRAWMSVQWVAP